MYKSLSLCAGLMLLAVVVASASGDSSTRLSLGTAHSSTGPGTTVRQTYDDWQYSVKGRHVGFRSAPSVHFCYTDLRDSLALSRYGYNVYDPTGGGSWPQGIGVGCQAQPVDMEGRWPNLALTPAGLVVLAGEDESSGILDHHLYWQIAQHGCFWSNGSAVPPAQYQSEFVDPDNALWYPVVEVREYMGDTVTHMVAAEESFFTYTGSSNVTEIVIQYYRKIGSYQTGTWEGPIVIDSANYPAEIAASPVSDKVAVCYVHHTDEAYGHSQDNDNDVYYRLSNDAGVTWEPVTNITDYDRSEASHTAWREVHCLYDTEDELHIIWNARPLPAEPYSQSGDVFETLSSSLFHWSERIPGDNAGGTIAKMHRAEFASSQEYSICGFGGANALSVGFFSISECNGHLYTVFSQWNDWNNGITDDCASGSDADWGGNGDIFLTVSTTLDGMRWDVPRNLTNTYTPNCTAPDCMNETRASMSPYGMDSAAYGQELTWSEDELVDPSGSYTGNHFLHLSYLEDHYPGSWTEAGEGEQTLNDLKWVRLACVGPVEYPCHADGDANNDAVGLTPADIAYLDAFINACGPAPVALYSCDLNGDGVVDSDDLQIYQDYSVDGISVFTPYGGYPVPCPCDPIPKPVLDVVNIFGLEHTSLGTACLEVVDDTLSVTRLTGNAESGFSVDLRGVYDEWQCEFPSYDPDSSLPLGTQVQSTFWGEVDGVPDQHLGTVTETKISPNEWKLAIDLGVSTYTVRIFDGESLVFEQAAIPTEYLNNCLKYRPPFRGYSRRFKRRHARGARSHCRRFGIIWKENGGSATFEEVGLHDLAMTCIEIESDDPDPNAETRPLSSVSILTREMDFLEIVSESGGLHYGDIIATNLGNAIITPVDTSLVVSNIGSSGDDGVRMDVNTTEGWSAAWLDLDPEETVQDGAFMATSYFGTIDNVSDQLIASITVEDVGDSLEITADVSTDAMRAVSSSTYTVQVYDSGTLVASVEAHEGPVIAHCIRWPFDGELIKKKDPSEPFGLTCGVTWRGFKSRISISDGPSVEGDSLAIIPENQSAMVDSLTSVTYLLKDMPQIVFTEIITGLSCCIGLTGNVDGDPEDMVDLSDLTALIDFLFISFTPPDCMEEANIDGDLAGQVDLGDLTALIDYLFISFTPPVPCQ